MIRVLIVDDELLAIRRLEIKLTRFRDVEVVGTCRDGDQALKSIKNLIPDLVLLDINMPGIDGLHVGQAAINMGIAVIFVTAFNQYAVEAFQQHALDYLLKPVDENRLAQALERYRSRKKRDKAADKIGELNSVIIQLRALNPQATDIRPHNSIWVKSRNREQKITVENIEWVEASRDYVTIHMTNAHTYFVRNTMNNFESLLDSKLFHRIHRSSIVNLSQITEISLVGNTQILQLASGAKLRVGRKYRATTNLRIKELSLYQHS